MADKEVQDSKKLTVSAAITGKKATLSSSKGSDKHPSSSHAKEQGKSDLNKDPTIREMLEISSVKVWDQTLLSKAYVGKAYGLKRTMEKAYGVKRTMENAYGLQRTLFSTVSKNLTVKSVRYLTLLAKTLLSKRTLLRVFREKLTV